MSLIALKQDDVLSVTARVRIGKDGVLTDAGLVAMSPTYSATLFVPKLEACLEGQEQLIAGPPAVFDTINVRAKRAKTVDGTTGEVRNLVVDEHRGTGVLYGLEGPQRVRLACASWRHDPLARR